MIYVRIFSNVPAVQNQTALMTGVVVEAERQGKIHALVLTLVPKANILELQACIE